MTPRYCFALPDVHTPVGGHTILCEMAEFLREDGHDVVLIYEGRHHRYPYSRTGADTFYNPAQAVRPRQWTPGSIRARARTGWHEWRSDHRNALYRPEERDVVVVPEFLFSEYADVYAKAPLIMVAQDVFGFMRAYTRHTKRVGPKLPDFTAILTTSTASRRAISTITSYTPHQMVLPIDSDPLTPKRAKKPQIAYMPRKRAEETEIVVNALRRRPAFEGVTFKPIRNVTYQERNDILRESLVFLSFSQMEGFGLPPAEAMAAECLVVGYTGVGGNEYFSPDYGFPIEDSDVIAFIEKTEAILTEYRRDPAALDRLRRTAAAHIRQTHTRADFEETIRSAWSQIDASVRADLALNHPDPRHPSGAS